MLRLDLIPESAREYAMDHVLDKVVDEEMAGYSSELMDELEMSCFFEGIRRKAFVAGNKDWAMNKVYLVRAYILSEPIDWHVAQTVAEIAKRIGLEEASSLLYFFQAHREVFEEIQSKLGWNKISLGRLERQGGYEFWEEQEIPGPRPMDPSPPPSSPAKALETGPHRLPRAPRPRHVRARSLPNKLFDELGVPRLAA